MVKQVSIIPKPGEHALIVGQNGSGKTAFACWMLERLEQAPVLIFDTKIEPKFSKFPASVIVETMEEALKYKDDVEVDYIVIRPPVDFMREPKLLDEMLWFAYQHFQGCPVYIDEAYTFHVNGRAGPGLVALLTRGRSRGISTIISTQRPVLLSRFCITEAKLIYIFKLTDKADKKRLDDVVPNYSDMPNPVKYGFYFYETTDMDEPILYRPITLDRKFDTGYTDIAGGVDIHDDTLPPSDAEDVSRKNVWI